MNRRTIKRPGYDCIRNPCGKNGCGTDPGSSHGIGHETWLYVVEDSDVILTLEVNSWIYPPSASQWPSETPTGRYLTLHVIFPSNRDEVRAPGARCDFVPKGETCYGDRSTTIGADDFVREHFVISAGFEQPESFWLALEARCRNWGDEARAERADTKWARCSHCDGTGTVPKGDACRKVRAGCKVIAREGRGLQRRNEVLR